MAGNLVLAIRGCLDWQRIGLAPPPAVTAATAAYMEAEDAMATWIDECCETDPQAWESSSALYTSWRTWADSAGEFAGSTKRFAQALETRGFQPVRKMNGRGFAGLRLQPVTASTSWNDYG